MTMQIDLVASRAFPGQYDVLVNGHAIGLIATVTMFGAPKHYTIVGRLGTRFTRLEDAFDALTASYR